MSESEHHTKLLAFLAGEFARKHHHLVVRIELVYTPPGGYRPDPLGTWTPDDGKSAELFSDRGHVFVERLVGEIIELAENHADTYGAGRHRFAVRAHQHMGGRQLHAFVVKPSFDGDDQALAQGQLADPSQTNLVGQLMRHIENRDRGMRDMMGTFLQTMSHNFATLRDENEALRESLAARDKEKLETMKLVEEAHSKEHERQIEALVVTGDKERKDLAVRKVLGLLPVAVSQGLSHWKKSHGGSNNDNAAEKPAPSPLAKLALRLVQSLKTAQRDLVEDTLGIEQRILLAEAGRVAAEGGSLVLPSLLNELASSLQASQVKAIMGCMEPEQAEMFVQLVSVSRAQVEADQPKPAAAAPATETTETTTEDGPIASGTEVAS